MIVYRLKDSASKPHCRYGSMKRKVEDWVQDQFTAGTNEVTITDVVNANGLPRPHAIDYMNTWCKQGWLEKHTTNRWQQRHQRQRPHYQPPPPPRNPPPPPPPPPPKDDKPKPPPLQALKVVTSPEEAEAHALLSLKRALLTRARHEQTPITDEIKQQFAKYDKVEKLALRGVDGERRTATGMALIRIVKLVYGMK